MATHATITESTLHVAKALTFPQLKLLPYCCHLTISLPLISKQNLDLSAVLGSLLLKSNSLHITLYFEESLCITVTYYLEIKVTSNILN